jgi:probable O-glycosylation ligase (exosortase A-associated)
MRDILLTVFIFALIPTILFRPYYGALLWAWVGMMNPHKMTYGFAYTLPFAMIIAIVTLLMFPTARDRRPFPWCGPSALLIVFYLWTCVTSLFAFNSFDNVYGAWLQVTKIQLMLLLTMMLIRDRRDIDQLIWVLVIAIGYFGFKGGIWIILTGGGERVWGPPGSFIEGNNEIGVALVMTLPLMYYLSVTVKTSTWIPFSTIWIRRILWIAMICTVAAILGTHSRGAFLAVVSIAVMLGIKGKRRALTIVALGIGLLLAIAFMPDNWSGRMDTISTHEDRSSQSRLDTWRMIWNLALHNPIFGGGFDFTSIEVWAKYAVGEWDLPQSPHSIYFQVLGEHGFVGLMLYLLLGFATWKLAARVNRQCAGRLDLEWASLLMRMIQVSLFGFAVGGAFLGLSNWDLPYYLVGLTAVVSAIVQEKLGEQINAQLPEKAAGPGRIGRYVQPTKPSQPSS